jgi:hypothetical protein
VVTDFEEIYAGTNFKDDTRTLVTTDDRQVDPVHVSTSHVVVGVAQARGGEFDKDFALLRGIEFDVFH